MLDRTRPAAPTLPGATYVRFLGAGGFADVFLYHQDSPSRDVAVKVIREEARQEDQERFRRETDTMALLSSHPSVVSVFDAGQTRYRRGYIVMEYCPPPHVGQLFKQEPPSVERVLKYAIQIGSAVETIHRSGYLHRDIKPANILLTPFKRPVLTDFGIAVPIEAQVVNEDFGGASPPWAPYEQQLGDEALTPAADVYCLGATVYSMLAGHAPHVDPSAGASNERTDMLRRAQTGAVPPLTRSDVPDQLRRVLRTAMAPQPADRYSTALALIRDLQKVQRDQGLSVTEADVMEQAPVSQGPEGENDKTVLRPVTAIDPYQGTQDALVADATRFKPRIVIPLAEVDESTSADTVLGRGQAGAGTLAPAAAPSGPAAAAAGAPPASHTTSGPRGQTKDMRSETTSPSPHSASPRSAQTEQVAHDSEPQQPVSARKVLTAALSAVLVLVVLGVGAWSVLRQEGGTQHTGASPTPQDVLGPGGELVSDQGVTNLRLQAKGKTVTATWDYDGEQSTTFLYSVVDPVEKQPVKETSEHTATVEAVPGRTCVEVVARSASGASSQPQSECLETP